MPRLSDRYRTLTALGRGGMGTVEIALERGLAEKGAEYERIVALKRLLPEATPRHAEMFLREARLAARLHHPNVAGVFDYGDVDGELFMALEYVEGEPLSRVIAAARERRIALAPAVVAEILADACDGLHAAHELTAEDGQPLKVVHRDVSPHNVMVSYDGAVKVVDFGVAKIEDDRGLTRTGEVKGKAAYMSPEQAMGDPLDRRSDLYSLGAVLFECLTARKMWEGTEMEVMRKLALEEPPKLAELAPHAPASMVKLYERLVARAADARPASASHVATALRAIATESRRPDDPTIADLMKTLFERVAEERKKTLDDAIARVDPDHVEVLRQSLAPGSVTRSTQARAAAVEADGPRASKGWIVAGALALAIGAAVLATTTRSGPTTPAVSGAPVVAPTPSAAPAPPPSSLLLPTTSTTTTTTTTPATTAPSTPVPNAKKPATKAPRDKASAKPLDVDPNAL